MKELSKIILCLTEEPIHSELLVQLVVTEGRHPSADFEKQVNALIEVGLLVWNPATQHLQRVAGGHVDVGRCYLDSTLSSIEFRRIRAAYTAARAVVSS